MSKVFAWTLWVTLIIIGIILTIPYSILECIIDKIDEWTEKLELDIIDNKDIDPEKKNGRNAEF